MKRTILGTTVVSFLLGYYYFQFMSVSAHHKGHANKMDRSSAADVVPSNSSASKGTTPNLGTLALSPPHSEKYDHSGGSKPVDPPITPLADSVYSDSQWMDDYVNFHQRMRKGEVPLKVCSSLSRADAPFLM